LTSGDDRIRQLGRKRANLLPTQAAVVGFRVSTYNLVGNKILPTGSSTGKVQYPGLSGYDTDLPQVALEMSGKTAAGPNSSRFVLRCIPDSMMTYGEYQPTPAFKTKVTVFTNALVDDGWGFVGRDLSKTRATVVSIAGNVVTLAAPIGVVFGTDYVIFNRVIDDADRPVKGSFFAVVGPAPTYTLQGLSGHNMGQPSGTARVDAVALYAFASILPSRAVVKKVGRPFESYRGRQSKRTA
jgi:hypothetical protein